MLAGSKNPLSLDMGSVKQVSIIIYKKGAFSAVATCLNNVGPGMNVVGPVGNFSSLSDVSKLVLSFDMLAG